MHLIIPRFVYRYNGSEPERIDCSEEIVRVKVGDKISHEVGAPGYGMIVYRVKLINDDGVWGTILSDSSRMLSPEQVY
jgi:hypothetical protein